MHTVRARILAVSGLFTVLSNLQATAAWAADWQVSKVSGQAWIATEGQKTDIVGGMVIAPGVSVHTSDRARVMLLRGTKSMVIGPKSIVAISEQPSEGLSTTVLEKVGTVSFDVEKQNVQHFSVETPMLAAVVKGTHFTVAVGRAAGQVKVARGTVQVTSLRTGQQTDVTAGQHASMGGRGGLCVSGVGQRAPVTHVAPRSPVPGLAAVAAPVGAPVSTATAAEVSAPATVSVSPAAAVATASAPASPAAAGARSSSPVSSGEAAATPSNVGGQPSTSAAKFGPVAPAGNTGVPSAASGSANDTAGSSNSPASLNPGDIKGSIGPAEPAVGGTPQE